MFETLNRIELAKLASADAMLAAERLTEVWCMLAPGARKIKLNEAFDMISLIAAAARAETNQ